MARFQQIMTALVGSSNCPISSSCLLICKGYQKLIVSALRTLQSSFRNTETYDRQALDRSGNPKNVTYRFLGAVSSSIGPLTKCSWASCTRQSGSLKWLRCIFNRSKTILVGKLIAKVSMTTVMRQTSDMCVTTRIALWEA